MGKTTATEKPAGNLRDALAYMRKQGRTTVPQLAEHFDRSQSTTDNWMRTAMDRGLVAKAKPEAGDMEGQMEGHSGRPPCVFSLTAKGDKFLDAPPESRTAAVVKAMSKTSDKPKAQPAAKTAAKPKAKAPAKGKPSKPAAKVKAKAPAKASKPAAKVKGRGGSYDTKATRAADAKAKEKAERDAKAKREKRAAEKTAKATATQAPPPPAAPVQPPVQG